MTTKLSAYTRRMLTREEAAIWVNAETRLLPLPHFHDMAEQFLFGEKPSNYVFTDEDRRAIYELSRTLQVRSNTRH